MAKIICFEGADGLGKSTQAILLEEYLLAKGFRAKYFKLPSKSYFGKLIYKLLDSGIAKKAPNLFQSINYFDKFIFQFAEILFSKYDYIILDRWFLSSIVYGISDGANEKFLNTLSKILIKPDITFVFFGENFLSNKNKLDSFESDVRLQKNAKKNYLLYGLLDKNSKFIFANDKKEVISKTILEIMEK